MKKYPLISQICLIVKWELFIAALPFVILMSYIFVLATLLVYYVYVISSGLLLPVFVLPSPRISKQSGSLKVPSTQAQVAKRKKTL